MRLLIDGVLSLPPSSISCFRDVTLYSSVFNNYEVLIESRRRDRDRIWNWLRDSGAHDFVTDFVRPSQESGVVLSPHERCNICVQSITAETLPQIINLLKSRARLYQPPASGFDDLLL